MSNTFNPPLGLGEALALVLASGGQFSLDQHQRDFFKSTWTGYWSGLMTTFQNDPQATACLQSLIPVMVNALRALGVQHARFVDKVRAASEADKIEIEGARQIAKYSPLSDSKWFGKAVGIIGGGGAGGLVTKLLVKTNLLTYFGICLGIVIGVFVLDITLKGISRRKLKKFIQKDWTRTDDIWRERNKEDLRRIAKGFLINALEVIERHYPDVAYAGIKNMSSILAGTGLDPATGAPASEELRKRCDRYLEQVLDKHLLIT